MTCPVGVWLVGYTMMGYGVCCSVGSYVTQALADRIGRGFFIGLGRFQPAPRPLLAAYSHPNVLDAPAAGHSTSMASS